MGLEVNPVILRAGRLLRRDRPLLNDDWKYTVRRERAWSSRLGTHEIALVFFRSSGCRFSKQGECAMCDYQIASPMDAEQIVGNVKDALTQGGFPGTLFVAPLGSMFDPTEVPQAAIDKILGMMARTEAKLFATETRMEFLNEDTLRRFSRPFGGRPKRINIGLESTDPWSLVNSIGKSIPVDKLSVLANMLHAHETELAANILIGSPWLSSAEIIESTLSSIREALAAGVDLCVLFPSNVRRWTVQHWLWSRGHFAPPSLWTMVEIVHRLEPSEAARVALSYFDRKPNDSIVAMPCTCERCQPRVVEALWDFAATGQRGLLQAVRQKGCDCREAWHAELVQSKISRIERARHGLECMAVELCGKEWWEQNRAKTLASLDHPS